MKRVIHLLFFLIVFSTSLLANYCFVPIKGSHDIYSEGRELFPNIIKYDTLSDVVNFYDIKSDTIIYRKVNGNVNTIAFKIKLKDKSEKKFEYFPIKSIEISDSDTYRVLQEINEEKEDLGISNIEFNDYNFDGYLDMYVYDACAILANCYGHVFLFDKGLHKFVLAMEFNELTSVSADNSKKEIYSFNRCCGGALYTYGVYKYINDKLTLVKEISEDADGTKGYIYKVKEMDKNGKMKVVKKVKSKEPMLLEE